MGCEGPLASIVRQREIVDRPGDTPCNRNAQWTMVLRSGHWRGLPAGRVELAGGSAGQLAIGQPGAPSSAGRQDDGILPGALVVK